MIRLEAPEVTLTDEELAKRFKEIQTKYNYYEEICHREMDELIMELLNSLGYTESMKIYDDQGKWYC